MIIFLFISLNMCLGCSKEPSHRDGSFEYPQHMFWLRNKKKFQFPTWDRKHKLLFSEFWAFHSLSRINIQIHTNKFDHKIVIYIFLFILSICFNICFGCSKEPSHLGLAIIESLVSII